MARGRRVLGGASVKSVKTSDGSQPYIKYWNPSMFCGYIYYLDNRVDNFRFSAEFFYQHPFNKWCCGWRGCGGVIYILILRNNRYSIFGWSAVIAARAQQTADRVNTEQRSPNMVTMHAVDIWMVLVTIPGSLQLSTTLSCPVLPHLRPRTNFVNCPTFGSKIDFLLQ